jgi:hypothetical protein
MTTSSTPSIHPPAATAASPAQISPRQMEAKIAALTAEDIDLLSEKMAEKIVNQLGPIKAARINAQVVKVKGYSEEMSTKLLHVRLVMNHLSEYKSKPFLSDIEAVKLFGVTSSLLSALITHDFSTPQTFLQSGMHIRLSDHEPETILNTIAQKVGIDLNLTNVAAKWHLDLKIDQELTQRKSDVYFTHRCNLVFLLLETSAGVEISRQTFTIGELEDAFDQL